MTRLPLSRVVEIAGMVDSPVATRRLPNPVSVDELTALAREVVALREAIDSFRVAYQAFRAPDGEQGGEG